MISLLWLMRGGGAELINRHVLVFDIVVRRAVMVAAGIALGVASIGLVAVPAAHAASAGPPGGSPTTLTTVLQAGGRSGVQLDTLVGAPVTDSAMLGGYNAETATGTVTYNVYSDSACTQLASAGAPQQITTTGQLPDSQPVSVTWPGAYYWQAVYSGDSANGASASTCGIYGEVEYADPGEDSTSVSTALSGGGRSGTSVSVPAGTAVTDTATLSVTSTATPAGAVRYNVYSDAACTVRTQAGASQPLPSSGTPPPSAPVTLRAPGTYYWQAQYSGDQANAGSSSPCGPQGEVETVTVALTTLTTSLSGGGKSGASITVPAGTAVKDSGTLSGANARTATGNVTYTVYSDPACSHAVSAGSPLPVADGGAIPDSAPVTLTTPGTYLLAAGLPG
jgi:hypothetical protein